MAVGSGVGSDLKLGTEVYSRVPEEFRGTASDLATSTIEATTQKPSTLSHIEAASLPLVALTALQALDEANTKLEGGLKGKTVYIPAGLSGVGSIAVQLAKRVFLAAKVITTLSTSKIPKVTSLVGEDVLDQIVDYTKEDPGKAIAIGSVDFMFDIARQATSSLHLIKEGGLILSVTGQPTPEIIKGLPNGAEFHFRFVHPSAEDLARLRDWVDKGFLRPVVGKVASLDDLFQIREECQKLLSGKGAVGKFVIEVEKAL